MARCPVCRAEHRAGARFCHACGHRLAAGAPERRKVATMLFCDLAGSTAMGERLDAESVREITARYFALVRDAVERHGGTVEKFVGDAAMAVFGVPVAHEDDALRAVRAAVDVRDGLGALNDRLGAEFASRVAVRIGVNTGEVVAGDAARRETFVAGDAVNVAARLEQAAAAGEILIGDDTRRLCASRLLDEPVPPVAAKGKSEPLRAHRVLGLRAGAPEGLAGAGAPLVGRSAELATLAAALTEAARTRRCGLATVVGEPGVGKSRLVAELCARAAGGARVVTGRCLSYGEGITFWPLAEIVRDAAGIRAEDDAPHARERIRRLVDGWAADRVAAAIGLEERAAPAEEIAAAFRELLQALAAERPLVCVVEDLHWAEPTLLDLLEQVCERAAAPVLLLCTGRPELAAARPDWPVSVRLEPLDREASERLLDELSDGAAPSGEPRARMLAAAGGVPLFLEELLAAQRERPGDAVLPQTLRALLTARLDRLPERERAAAERGAVEGEVFHRGAVRALWAGGGTAAHAAVEALAAADVVRPAAPAIPSEVAYRFRHILIRDAAYAATAKRLRAELHERFADWLEATVGSRLPEYEEIAGYHLEQAHRLHAELGPAGERGARLARRAATHLVAAGQRAGARGDDRALVTLLRRAAALLGGDDPQRALLLAQVAAALVELGEFAAADEALAEGDRAARAAGDARMRVHVDLGRALLHNQVRGDFDQARLRRTAERAVAVFGRAGDDRGLAHAYRALAWVELAGARGGPQRQAIERSIEHARRAGDRRQEIEAVFLLPLLMAFGPTPCTTAVALCARMLDEYAGERKIEGLALQALGDLDAMDGRFEDARRRVDAGREIVWELGLTLYAGAQILGEVELLAGNPRAAEAAFRGDFDRLSSIGETAFFSTVASLLADAVHRQGRHAEAVAFTEAAEAATAPGDVLSQAGWRSVRAKALARLGDVAEAQRLARDAVAAIARSDFPNARGSTLMDVAEVRREAGDGCGARAACLAARAEFARKGCRVEVARAEAELAALSAAP